MHDERRIPEGSEWTWRYHRQGHGVHVYADRIQWWSDPPDPARRFAGGGAMDQPIEEFLARGPAVECPLRVLSQVVAAFGLEEAPWWRYFLASGDKRFNPLPQDHGGHSP